MHWHDEFTIVSPRRLHRAEVTIVFPALFGVSVYPGDMDDLMDLRCISGKGRDSLRVETISHFFSFPWCLDVLLVTEAYLSSEPCEPCRCRRSWQICGWLANRTFR